MRHNQRHRGWRLTQATLAAALIYHQLDPAVLLRLYPRARPLRPQAPLQAAVPFFDAAHFSRANEKELLRRHNENHRDWQLTRAELTASLYRLSPAAPFASPAGLPAAAARLQEFADFSARGVPGRGHTSECGSGGGVGQQQRSRTACTARNTNNAPSSGGTMPLSLASEATASAHRSPSRHAGSWGWRAARGRCPTSTGRAGLLPVWSSRERPRARCFSRAFLFRFSFDI